ncbi:MAG: thioredoxin family protein [Planctomycetota bacterium]
MYAHLANATVRRILLTLVAAAVTVPAAIAQDVFGGGFRFPDPVGSGGFAFEDDQLVTLEARWTPATADGLPAMVEVTASVAESYYIYSVTQPAGGPQPTKLRLDAASGVTVAGPWVATKAPKVDVDQVTWIGLPIEKHFGTVTWRAPITFREGVDPATATVSGTVDAQACDPGSCVPLDGLAFTASVAAPGAIPPTPLVAPPGTAAIDPGAAPVEADAVAAEGVSLAALAPVLGAALVGGLILNLMPCVLPVIGLKVLSFAEQAGHDRGRVLAMNLAYTAGLMSVFLLLATLTASLGYGWGELNTHPEYRIGIVVLVFAMALSFLGVWEIPIPGFAGGSGANDLQAKEGFSGAFFKGIFTTILAVPCSGPFLGSAIGYTLGKPTWVPFAVFAAIGLGMASPYLLIGAFPSLVRFLPKPGAWMETFKQVMGFVLMASAVYFLSVVSEANRLPLLASLVAVAAACWWIGSTPLTVSASKRATAWAASLALAVIGGYAAFATTSSLLGPSDHELAWQPYSPASLAAAKSQGKTVLVDFTADWCPTCQINSRVAINTERVKAVVEANGVTPLLADWSDRNDTVKQTLAELGSRSIPFLAIYPADRPEQPIRLPDLITESQLLDALAAAGATSDNAAAAAIPAIEVGAVGPVSVNR